MADAYNFHEPAGWATKVATFEQRLIDKTTVVLQGKCPHCEHQMSVELPIERRSGKALKTQEADEESLDSPFDLVAACNCQHKHAERPADLWGCGAFGTLSVGGSDA